MDPSYEYTNTAKAPKSKKPYADKKNVKIMKELQKLQSVGLVEPYGAEFMYYAAMDKKACKLTTLGKHYWKMVDGKKL
jgi:hypothetical protein